MANWCNNAVLFTGRDEDIHATRELFLTLQQKEEKREHWDLPSYVTAENSAMLDIEVDTEKIFYRSPWLPNLLALIQIADHFNIGFINRYDEPPMSVYGEAKYENGNFSNVYLDAEDFRQVEFDELQGVYIYNDTPYEHDWDLFDAMLDIKLLLNVIKPYEQDQRAFLGR